MDKLVITKERKEARTKKKIIPLGSTDVCLLCLLGVVQVQASATADPLSRGVLLSVGVSTSVINVITTPAPTTE
jgi:hypothetical protein